MLIHLSQIAPVVGDFEGNVKKIKASYDLALKAGARLCLTPELSLNGYPPHDLLERPEIFERNKQALEELLRYTLGKRTALLVGHIESNASIQGRPAYNKISVLEDGKIIFSQAKSLLPTYDVFDESRYFEPAKEVHVFEFDGKKIAIGICEDFWALDSFLRGRKLYTHGPVDQFCKLGVDLAISISASPFEQRKLSHRKDVHAEVVRRLKAPLIYLNQFGATDEILFDGASFVLTEKGDLAEQLPRFKEFHQLVDTENLKLQSEPVESEMAVLNEALVCGIREYFKRTGFSKAILGLSGGIDSAVVACLAAQALGAENVLGVAMASQYSAPMSLEDAETLAKNLGIRFQVHPIKFYNTVLSKELSQSGGQTNPIAMENLQSRIRGLILMTCANHENALVLTTGNKSELATGYCTQYGDMVGALAPLGDVLKTQVFKLARHLNQSASKSSLIPERTITRPPSAELRPDQKDEDTLPPYEQLDALIAGYIEDFKTISELKEEFGSWVEDTLSRIELNEYKRRQSAPVLKVSPKAFGLGRRVPIAKVWNCSSL